MAAAAVEPVWLADGRDRVRLVRRQLCQCRAVPAPRAAGPPAGRLSAGPAPVAPGAAGRSSGVCGGAVYPLARQDGVTIALSLAVAVTALVGYLRAGGPERRARAAALVAASAVALVLGLGAIARVVDAGTDATGLWVYQAVLVLVAVGLFADLLWGRWTQAAITGLVVDLGEPEQAGTLQAKLARAVGDPSLVVAYRLPDTDGYVDEAGRPVTLPAAGASRTVTHLHQGGQQIAALVHDAAVLDDPDLVTAVAAAAGVAVANARLQAEVRAGSARSRRSRRRIVEASDAERRRLEGELREGAERRLAHVTDLLADSRSGRRGPPAGAAGGPRCPDRVRPRRAPQDADRGGAARRPGRAERTLPRASPGECPRATARARRGGGRLLHLLGGADQHRQVRPGIPGRSPGPAPGRAWWPWRSGTMGLAAPTRRVVRVCAAWPIG